MDNGSPELSARYYIAEASTWVLGGVLTVARFVGLAPSQAVPLLNVVPERQQHLPRILAVLLVAAVLYMFVEWRQSSTPARALFWARARVSAAALCACVALWLSYPLIAQATRLAGTSPTWWFAFCGIGYLIATLASTVVFASLMIRTADEATRLGLPRVPVATRCQYLVWAPAILLLAAGYYVLWLFSPDPIRVLAPFVATAPCLHVLAEDAALLFFSRDETGGRVTYRQRIARLRKAVDFHDYSCFIAGHRDTVARELKSIGDASPQAIQTAMQARMANGGDAGTVRFHVQQLEGMQIRLYAKDGNPGNEDRGNCGVRIRKEHGSRERLRVRVVPDTPGEQAREMEIPVSQVESLAEDYIASHPGQSDLPFREVFSYAVNQTVISTMVALAGPPLHRAAWCGEEGAVRGLMARHETEVDAPGQFGWTALLVASAQGYPGIVSALLEAGANPDTGNALGITPLMYGARYGNMDVVRLLIDFHARTDAQDVYGCTALMRAAAEGHGTVVEALLNAGADTSIKAHGAMTALDMACAAKHGLIAKRLRAAALSPVKSVSACTHRPRSR